MKKFLFFILTSYSTFIMAQNLPSFNHIDEYRNQLSYYNSTDGKIAYLDVGQGNDVILLLHGVPTNSFLYRSQINPLLEAGFRVIVPDMLGFGASEKPNDMSVYHFPRQAQRIMDLMASLNIASWTHVMHDAGGPWTWEMYLLDSTKFKKLIILNTILFEEGFDPPINLKPGTIKTGLIKEFYRSKFGAKVIVNSTFKAGTSKCDLNKNEKRAYWQPLTEGANVAITHFFLSFDYIKKLLPRVHKKIIENKTEVYSIWGMKDNILIGSIQLQLLKERLNINEENIIQLEDSDHFLMEDSPTELSRHLIEFAKR